MKAQIKSMFLIVLFLLSLVILIYAVSTTLITPSANTVASTDGSLDLRGKCEVFTPFDGYTSWNITNATLWTNIGGTWQRNKTIQVSSLTAGGNITANTTWYFNWTNVINRTAEGSFIWNIECNEMNWSNGSIINKASAGNQTNRVEYSKPTISITGGPEDDSYDLDGTGFNFTADANAVGNQWSLTRLDLWVNVTGTSYSWRVNETNFVPQYLGNASQLTSNFSNLTVNQDGAIITWGFAATQQNLNWSDSLYPNVTKQVFTANRTIRVEFPPNITIRRPSDGNWSQNRQTRINFSVQSSYTSGTTFACLLFANDTGSWQNNGGTFFVVNGTYEILPTFEERADLRYGIKCAENANQNIYNWSINLTLRTDFTNPTVTVATPNNTITKSNVTIRFTPSDNMNLSGVTIFTNFNAGNFFVNYSNASPISGEAMSVVFEGINEGEYNFSIELNDSSGRKVRTGNYTAIVDTVKSNIFSIKNVTYDRYCDRLNITWSTNETTNFTIYYGTTPNVTTTYINNSAQVNQSYIINFGLDSEVTYYFNITSCDRANNCNNSEQFSIDMPARICTGWNYYGIYDSIINLSTIQNQSGADYVYFWNQTKQNWVSMVAGLSSSSANQIGKRRDAHVVLLYENTNSTWRRNVSNAGYYQYNITSGDNFVNLPIDFTVGNFTESLLNNSREFPSTIGNETNGGIINNGTIYGPWNITYMAFYNNSNNRWISHVWNFTYTNMTQVKPFGIETAWFYSDYNLTWNGTGIVGNWTRYIR